MASQPPTDKPNEISKDRKASLQNETSKEQKTSSKNETLKDRKASLQNETSKEQKTSPKNEISKDRKTSSKNEISKDRKTSSKNEIQKERRPSSPLKVNQTNASASNPNFVTNNLSSEVPSPVNPDTPIELQTISTKILLLILGHSSYVEIFKYRGVSKLWLKIIDNEFKAKDLVIFLKQFPFNEVWSFTTDLFEIKKTLKITKLNAFFRSNQMKIFKNLERLTIYNFPSDNEQIDLELLNQLPNLVHLELRNLKLKDQSKLNLPNLKLLYIVKQSSGKIKIDAPQLIKFKTSFNLNHFKFEHPQSVQYLECTHFNPCIKSFTNLEYLYVEFISYVSSLFLEKMIKLKEIQFFDSGLSTVFNSLKKQKKKYNLKELTIFYLGINFDHYPENDFRFERFHLNDYNVHYYADNYKNRLATIIPFIRKLTYNSLIRRFPEISTDIHLKFPNIGYVIVDNKLTNPDSFIKFLYNCKVLKILSFKYSTLEQKHLDSLPEVAPSLTYLTFENEPNKLNFNFILKFRNLIKFQVDQFVSFDLVQQSFEKLTYLKSFIFKIQSGTILIKKSNYYLLIISNHYQDCFNNLENLIKVLKKNYGTNLNFK